MSVSLRDPGFRKHVVLVAATLFLTACSSSNPATPTPPAPGASAPTLSSPADDAVVAARPSLVVNNVTGQGTRTYDFQVADSAAALTGPDTGLFASQTGVAEGANGHTSYDFTRDLAAGQRYYWRSRVTQGGTAGPWSDNFRFRAAAGANAPPIIQSITAAGRAEPNMDVVVTAVVQDQETSPANLVYQWAATGGSFSGTGATVRWQVQAVNSPTAFDLTLTVIERYTVAVDGGGVENRENRVSAQTTVHVNDSEREITVLATTFIDDFLHSDRPPEFCVRNFSDSCQGKQDELNDIRANRAMFTNDPSQSSMGGGSLSFYEARNGARTTPSLATFAELLAPCRFAATNRSTGVFGFANGTCQLTSVYENWQWRLCDSHFLTPSNANAMSLSFRF